jgi:hypothetical protein
MHHARSETMTDCSRLITFSKRITANGGGSEVECQDGCECDGTRLFIVQHRLRMRLESASCDETVGEIPDGSLFEAKLTHHLRLPSRCGAWIGYHEGSFRIVVDDTPVVEGEMRATHGFNLQLPGDDRCCDFMHSEGFMTGRTTSTKPQLDQCQLMANYRTTQEIGPSSDPCDPLSWLYWEATVAGILDCPCVE